MKWADLKIPRARNGLVVGSVLGRGHVGALGGRTFSEARHLAEKAPLATAGAKIRR